MLGDLSGRVEKCVLRWFGHVERMYGERMAKKIYNSGVEGTRGRGRPNRVWMDGAKKPSVKEGGPWSRQE